MRIHLIDIADMPVCGPDDAPEAKALSARIDEVVRYARANIYNPVTDPNPGLDTARRYEVVAGPLRCVFTHTQLGSELWRLLSLSIRGGTSVEQLPTPLATAAIAKMFGFRGRLGHDYAAAPHECECAVRCMPNIICGQLIELEN